MAAAPPPVDVYAPPGPAAPESPIFVSAVDAVVTNLPWLPWGPAALVAGVQRVSISNSEALKAFAVKCQVDGTPPAMAAMSTREDGFRARIKLLAQREYHRVDGRGMRA